MDDDNDIQIVGRMSKSERLKVYADVVYTMPIENAMKPCEKIREIAVIGRDTGIAMGHEVIYCVG